jgi:hypothetical protein
MREKIQVRSMETDPSKALFHPLQTNTDFLRLDLSFL